MSQENLAYSESIPILRSFESDGKRYMYGYACIFKIPDDFGTVITKQVVESSEARLRKFPAVHFNHRTSLGQIIWDKEIKGFKTFIDEYGFHVLVRVYDQCDREWGMIQNGKWGFSYGFLPDKVGGIGEKCFINDKGKKCYPAFVKGFIYEISVVDAPAHPNAIAHVVRRIERMKKPNTPSHMHTMIGFQKVNIYPNGKMCLCQEEKAPKGKIPEPTPECLIMLAQNTISKNKEEKTI